VAWRRLDCLAVRGQEVSAGQTRGMESKVTIDRISGVVEVENEVLKEKIKELILGTEPNDGYGGVKRVRVRVRR
jgi:metal-dependent HD superfamily phosphatase/phosphodiesterase